MRFFRHVLVICADKSKTYVPAPSFGPRYPYMQAHQTTVPVAAAGQVQGESMRLQALTIFTTLTMAALPALAHHSFATEFDMSKPVTLEGVVTGIDWVNPHVYFYVDVSDDDGRVVNWKCETRGPNGLERQGWRKDSLKKGDRVIVNGYPAKDATHMVDGRKVTFADGSKILSGKNE
jgi:hypothetical protein